MAGTQYTAFQKVETQGRFHCACCGYSAEVRVVSVGNASASVAPLGSDHARAQANAAAGAELAAHRNLAKTLGLARCPKCHKRDPVWLRRHRLEHGLKLGLTALLAAGVVTLFLSSGLYSAVTLTVAPLLSAAIACGVYWLAVDPTNALVMADLGVKFPKE